MAHEVGLVLGLAQPDAPGHANYAMVHPLNSSNCGATAALLPGQPNSLAVSSPLSGEWVMMNQLLTRKVPTHPPLGGGEGEARVVTTSGIRRG